jgi:hypothetical protein
MSLPAADPASAMTSGGKGAGVFSFAISSIASSLSDVGNQTPIVSAPDR